jgi:hypothetical protein
MPSLHAYNDQGKQVEAEHNKRCLGEMLQKSDRNRPYIHGSLLYDFRDGHSRQSHATVQILNLLELIIQHHHQVPTDPRQPDQSNCQELGYLTHPPSHSIISNSGIRLLNLVNNPLLTFVNDLNPVRCCCHGSRPRHSLG